MKDKLKEMMEAVLDGKYDCNEFSYDFPDCMLDLEDEDFFLKLDDMLEICAAYDPYKSDEPELLNKMELLEKIKEIYDKVFTYETVCEKLGFPIEDMAKHFHIPKDITEDREFSTPLDNLTHEEMEYVCAYLRKRNIVVTEKTCAEHQNH